MSSFNMLMNITITFLLFLTSVFSAYGQHKVNNELPVIDVYNELEKAERVQDS